MIIRFLFALACLRIKDRMGRFTKDRMENWLQRIGAMKKCSFKTYRPQREYSLEGHTGFITKVKPMEPSVPQHLPVQTSPVEEESA